MAMCNFVYQSVYLPSFGEDLCTSLSQGCGPNFGKTPVKKSGSSQGCAFWVPKTKQSMIKMSNYKKQT